MSFPNHTKSEWLAKVAKDLRGKPLDSLNFTVAGAIQSPFWHAEDQLKKYPPVVSPRKEACKTGIALEVTDAAEANKVILDLLNKGANALLLFSDTLDVVAQQDKILQDVLLEYVDVYFQTSAFQAAKNQSVGRPTSRFDLAQPGKTSSDDSKRKREKPQERLFSPQYSVFSSANTPLADAPLPQRFAEALRQATEALADQPTDFKPVFWVEADDNYLNTIANLRALRLCYQLIAHEYGQPRHCRITVDPFTKLTDKYSGMVSTSAICTAAVIGGADTVFVPSGDTEDSREKTFLRRVAINGMNIIDHEAYLNRVADPAAGSYYLEALTDTFARQIWADFQQTVAQ